jgi:2-oxoacid dehydrogenases acyltransferase (catalytic domain)
MIETERHLDVSPRSTPGRRIPRVRQRKADVRSSSRDRVSLITWTSGQQAQIHCSIAIEWDRVRIVHPKITPIALVGYAVAQALQSNLTLNRRVALWSIRPHQTIRLSFAVDAAPELRIAVVDNAASLSPRDFQRSLIQSARVARAGTGPLTKAISLIEWLPVIIGRPVVRAGSLITAGLGIGLLGVPGAPFGAALISSVDRFKLPAATVPFIPFTRCALICSVGSITATPVVRHAMIEVIDTVEVSVTIDHRIADGSQLAAFLTAFELACYQPAL